MNDKELSDVVDKQIDEILALKEIEAKGDETVRIERVVDVLGNDPIITDLMRTSMFHALKEGIQNALMKPSCKHCVDGKWCSKKRGFQTTQGWLCVPLGLGNLVLQAVLLGRPSCPGYEV